MAWDKIYGHLIRYLVNHGFYKPRFNPICKHCGEANSWKHLTNICPKFDELRDNTWRELYKLINTHIKIRDKFNGDLERALLNVYFKPGSKCAEKLEVLKKFLF